MKINVTTKVNKDDKRYRNWYRDGKTKTGTKIEMEIGYVETDETDEVDTNDHSYTH